MNPKIEKDVENYLKTYNPVLYYKGSIENDLRNWGKFQYHKNHFKKESNENLWKCYIVCKENFYSIQPKGILQEIRIADAGNFCSYLDKYKMIRFEMYKRGMVDSVYDGYDKSTDEDILERIKSGKLEPIEWKSKEELETNIDKAYKAYSSMVSSINEIKRYLNLPKDISNEDFIEACKPLEKK